MAILKGRQHPYYRRVSLNRGTERTLKPNETSLKYFPFSVLVEPSEEGFCCNDISDTAPAIELPQYMNLARSIEPQDRTYVFTLSWSVQSLFGKGRRWINGGIGARVLGGWQMNASPRCIAASLSTSRARRRP